MQSKSLDWLEFRKWTLVCRLGLITLSVVMEHMRVDEIARKSMENEKRRQRKKNPWTLTFETALCTISLPKSVFRPICAVG